MTVLSTLISTILCLILLQMPATTSSAEPIDYMPYPIRHCKEQSNCLKINLPRGDNSCDAEGYRTVCLYWETKAMFTKAALPRNYKRCKKTHGSLSHVCPVYSTASSSENILTPDWQAGGDNQVCTRVIGGEQACFAVRDWNSYAVSKERKFSVSTSNGSEVVGTCALQKHSYCRGREGVADNLWCFDTLPCNPSPLIPSTTTQASTATAKQYSLTDTTTLETKNELIQTHQPTTYPMPANRTTETESKSDKSQQVPTCAGQSECLRLQGAGANSPCNAHGQREVCMYWQPDKHCIKKTDTFSYVCPLNSTIDLNANVRTNNWKSGVDNSVCKKVDGGTWACFALSDATASRAESNSEPYYQLYSESSGVTDALCWVSWGYNYCGETTEHTWCVPTTSC